MEVNYSITLHPQVISRDIPQLDVQWKIAIQSAIRTKLTTLPEIYGKPLRQTLKGYRALRVGDYRIVFQIQKKLVRIIAILHRSAGYKGIEKRIL